MSKTAAKLAKFETKRLEILRAAARVFSRLGFHRSSINDIAEELGITAAALYYYVDSKEELLFEASKIAASNLEQSLEGIRANKDLSGLEKVRTYFILYVEGMVDDFGRCLALTSPEDVPEPLRKPLMGEKRSLTDGVRGLIRAGVKDGSISPCNDMLVAFALYGVANTMARWWSPDGKLTAGQAWNIVFDTFITGLSPQGAKAKPKKPRRRAAS